MAISAGMGEPPAEGAPVSADSSSNGEQPPEVKQLLQEMGMGQAAAGGRSPAAPPLQIFGVIAAGVVGVATDVAATVGSAFDRLMLKSYLGTKSDWYMLLFDIFWVHT